MRKVTWFNKSTADVITQQQRAEKPPALRGFLLTCFEFMLL